MQFKTRAFGLFIGAMLVLSLANGVVAQTTTTTVRLTEATCSPGITQTSVNFGTYIYDPNLDGGRGGFKAATAADGKASITVTDLSTGRRANCSTQVAASLLVDRNNANGITVSLRESPSGTFGNPITVSVAPGGNKTIDAALPDSLIGSASMDTYTGTITVTNVAGS